MSTGADARPFCSEVSRSAGEPLGATASRVEHWLLVEYGGYWPYEPLDAAVFAGGLRDHLEAQLAATPRSRLLLVKRPGRGRRDRVRIFVGTTPERGSRFWTLEVGSHADLVGLDLARALAGEGLAHGEPLDHPLLLVCTHGIRDRCCARYGQVLTRALGAHADPDWVWQSSHVGGDRFAGNLVVLPDALSFGRVGRQEAGSVLDRYLAGRIELDSYRGRSAYGFPVQAAELEVRQRTGLDGIHDLRLLEHRRRAAGAWTVKLLAEVAGEVHEVEVRLELGEERFLTCKAKAPARPRRYVAVAHRVRPERSP